MNYTTIDEYNNYLIENQININIIDYVKKVNTIEFKINIDFINDFIELVNKKECCIPHNMLEKYGVLKLTKGIVHIKELLEQYEFKNNIDYLLLEVRDQLVSSTKYLLHPRAFKICLMRSINTKIYANYYLLLEEYIKYFNDYQILLKETYIIKLKNKIIKKNNKIDYLEEKSNTIIKNNEELLNTNKLMQKSLNKAHYKLDNTHKELENTNIELDTTYKTLTVITKKLNNVIEERDIKKKNILKYESFVVMFNSNEYYKYKVIRGKKDYVNTQINKLKINGYIIIEHVEILNNASNIWCLIKEQLNNNIEYNGNNLNLINIEQETFIIKVNEIYNKQKNAIYSS